MMERKTKKKKGTKTSLYIKKCEYIEFFVFVFLSRKFFMRKISVLFIDWEETTFNVKRNISYTSRI